jgi:DNA-binding transcriptional MerR regulator
MENLSISPPEGADGDRDAPAYRSGVAARLAGLPVETLRVWERRYGLSATPRSLRGQRLYSAAQVRRLGMLKQLVDQGHPIGVLAGLSLEQLEDLAGAAGGTGTAAGPLRIAVVGRNLARRMQADRRGDHGLDVQRSCDDLEHAAAALAGVSAEALVVELSELDDSAVPLIVAARDALAVSAVIVLYRFCASATIRQLRMNGCLVARVPAELGELTLLCRTAMAGKSVLPAAPQRLVVAPRRFNDDVLSTVTNASSTLQCECPRHLADLLLMTGSFERYSAQCASRNEADAQLHKDLEHAAGLARTVLEAAMERLARAEGLSLPDMEAT